MLLNQIANKVDTSENIVKGVGKKGFNLIENQIDKLHGPWNREKVEKYGEMFGLEIRGPRDILDNLKAEVEIRFEDQINDLEEILETSFIFIEDSVDQIEELLESVGEYVPDLLEGIPLVSELLLGVRLLSEIKNVNDDFKELSSDKKARINAVKVLVFCSKNSVNVVMGFIGSTAGAAAGGAIGTVAPGPGNIIGGAVGGTIGTIGGLVSAKHINKFLLPHSTEISYKLLNLKKEDLFYYKNKNKIDLIGLNLKTSKEKYNELLN